MADSPRLAEKMRTSPIRASGDAPATTTIWVGDWLWMAAEIPQRVMLVTSEPLPKSEPVRTMTAPPTQEPIRGVTP